MRALLPLLTAATLATPALAQTPRVITDIPAVGSLVALVMGDLGAPEVLLAPGSDEHSYQLRPSQARALQDSDLLIWVGPELTPWLIPAAENITRSGAVLGLLASEGTRRQDFVDHEEETEPHDAHTAEPAGEDAHDHSHDHEHEHEHTGTDPHAWLDPDNARVWIENIAASLAHTDPENAATYRDNAATAQTQIAAMTQELEAQIAPLRDSPFVVTHDAYGYLQSHFALNITGSILLGDASASGASHPRDLLAKMQSEGAVCIFPETQIDAKPAQLLAEGTTVRVGRALDPSGSGHPVGPALYEAMMRDLVGSIADCLKG